MTGKKSLALLVEELRRSLRDLGEDPLYQVIKGVKNEQQR